MYRLKLSKGEETIIALTHWFQLTNELFFCPFLLLGPQVYGIGNQHLVVIGVGNIQIMNQHNIWILKLQWNMVTEKKYWYSSKINIYSYIIPIYNNHDIPEEANNIACEMLVESQNEHSIHKCTEMESKKYI